MSTTAEKIGELTAEISALEEKARQLNEELLLAKPEKQEALARRLKKTIDRLQAKTSEKELLEIQLAREEIALKAMELTRREETLAEKQLKEGDRKTLQRIIDAAHTVMNLGATRLIIAKQEREFVEFLRRVVAKNPTGWTVHEDPAKRYKFFCVGRLSIVLQDSPSYDITLEDLVAWIGYDLAHRLYVRVDTAKLVKDIEAGRVFLPNPDFALDDIAVTMEDWYARRKRTVGEPKVVIKEDDTVGREKVLVVRPELLSLPIDELANLTDLTGHELNPLREAGIQVIGQIRGFSGEQLLSIPGIGRIRAAKIMDAISELSVGAAEEPAAAAEGGDDSDA